MKLVGVIPAKNEGETVGKVLSELRDNIDQEVYEAEFIVASSSRDNTDEIAREHGAEVIKDGGTGLGEAMYRGLKKALEHDPDLIFSIDSDLQFQPDELGRLLEASDEADLVLGSRFLESGVKYGMSLTHRVGNKILTGMVNHATGLSLTDAQTGYRVMKPEIAEELRMVGRHTYVQETIIDAHSNGFTIKEVPVEFHEREEGGSKVVRSISKYAIRTLPVILHRSGYTQYLMNGIGLVSLTISFITILFGIISPNHITLLLGAILMLLSLQIFFTGMYVDSRLP